MHRRTVRISALTAVVVIGALVAFLITRPVQQGATPVDSPLVGQVAPGLHATTLSGAPVTLSSLRGHVVALSFFASWCPPCRAEAPELASFAYRARAAPGATRLYAVVYEDSNAAAMGFVRSYGGTYPVLGDPGGSIALAYGVTGPPVTVVIDPAGRVAAVLDGAVTAAQLESVTAAAARGAA